MAEGNSLINLGDLSRPATVLIEKVSDALGGIFKPFQIRRVAKAEADAEIIKAQADIEVTELQRRALVRFISEESKKQENIEKIISKTIPLLRDDSKPQDIEDDWITNFFEKCRIVSDEEMQILWAKVLSGEANHPSSYSKKTVNIVGSIEKSDAQLFTALCCFKVLIDVEVPVIRNRRHPIYKDMGLNYETLNHLDDMGLIKLNKVGEYARIDLPGKMDIIYYGQRLRVQFKNNMYHELKVGKVLFTRSGHELSRICESKPVPDFLRYIEQKWNDDGVILSTINNL